MSLGTLDRRAPSLFKQGPSALSKLIFFSTLCVLLMVADMRFHITEPLRAGVSTALYPLQWLASQPVRMVMGAQEHFESLNRAQQTEDEAKQRLAEQSIRANQVDDLLQENERLRNLLDLRKRMVTKARAAQVLRETSDIYTRRVIIDRGSHDGIMPGSPVIDESGVLGQVTRVDWLSSEVMLVVDPDMAIPVLNTRTGVRGVAYGDPVEEGGLGMELRFVLSNADVREGDILTTSGVDDIYPPGLEVARVSKVERLTDTAFARVDCTPSAQMLKMRHIMVLQPLAPVEKKTQETPEVAEAAKNEADKNKENKSAQSANPQHAPLAQTQRGGQR